MSYVFFPTGFTAFTYLDFENVPGLLSANKGTAWTLARLCPSCQEPVALIDLLGAAVE
jgi:hypothetical protein